MLWAAAAFAIGIVLGDRMWRPPLWWMAALGVLLACGFFLLRRRPLAARALTLAGLAALGSLCAQARSSSAPNLDVLQFADGEEVLVTAHITHEGNWRSAGSGLRQVLDVETEQVEVEGKVSEVHSGVRVSFYDKPEQDAAIEVAPRIFEYGERLKFRGKLSPPHNYRNPGAFDYRAYLAEKGIAALASAKAEDVEVLPGFAGHKFERWRSRVHRSVVQKVHALWPPADAALIDAMVVGEDAFLGAQVRTDFQRTGTFHVLVVSGMNVGIFAFTAFWVVRRFGAGEMLASVLTVLLSVGYAILTDVGAPIWRATLMLVLFLGARLLYRERSMLNAVGVAGLGLLAVDPRALFGASFQLTFLCVLLIAAVGVPLLERTSQPIMSGLRNIDVLARDFTLPPKITELRLDLRMIARRLQRFLGRRIPLPLLTRTLQGVLGAFEVLAISAVMQIGLVLPMAYYFHRATVVGLPANMLVVPLTEIMMPAAVVAVTLGYASMPLAKIPALVAGLSLHAIVGTLKWLGGMRAADLRVPVPSTVAVVLASVALVLAMFLSRRKTRWMIAGLTGLVAAAVWICAIPPSPLVRPGVLELTAIDVGQGDSLLLVSPQGRTLLVDAGGLPHWMHSEFDIGEAVVSPYLWSRGIHRLDAAALTHAHADHMGGMAAVLTNFRPRELWIGAGPPDPELQKLLQLAKRLGIQVIVRKEGDICALGGAAIQVFAPDPDNEATSAKHANEDSLVMKISYGRTSTLLEGDAEKKTERRVAEESPQADLLKVAHHGSATSTLPELLDAVQPRWAVISVGPRNVYKHPREEVLERLGQAGVRTYRTDLDGATTFYLDGDNVSPGVPDSR